MIRTYKCRNGVVEKSKFWVPAQVIVRRGRVKGNTGAAKRDANARAAVRTLARKLNCNFTKKDILLTCKYDDEHLQLLTTHKEQDRLTANFIKRLKRALRKVGVDVLKVIVVPSEIDGPTKKPRRPHLHIVLSGDGVCFQDGQWWVGEKTLSDIWGMGSTYARQLHDQPDLTPLAVYLLRQARDGKDEKKYSCSRNMAEPIITETVARSAKAMRQPARALLLESGEYHEENGCHYIRYVPATKEEKMSRNSTSAAKRGDILRHDLR